MPSNEFANNFIEHFGREKEQNLSVEFERIEFIMVNLRYCSKLERAFSLNSDKFKIPIFKFEDVPLAALLSLCTFVDLYLEGLISLSVVIVNYSQS